MNASNYFLLSVVYIYLAAGVAGGVANFLVFVGTSVGEGCKSECEILYFNDPFFHSPLSYI